MSLKETLELIQEFGVPSFGFAVGVYLFYDGRITFEQIFILVIAAICVAVLAQTSR